MAFCRAYPQLSSVIVDHASALTSTGAALAAAGLADRIALKPGDLRDEEWGTDYDVVLLLSIAHNHTAADNAHILERIAGVLKPGGLLVIYEYPADEPMAPYVAAFHLVLLTETGSKPWAATEIQGWLTRAGFSQATAHTLAPADKGTLFTATRLG
jgi:SAM-dependent methyltransferase